MIKAVKSQAFDDFFKGSGDRDVQPTDNFSHRISKPAIRKRQDLRKRKSKDTNAVEFPLVNGRAVNLLENMQLMME